MTLEICHGPWRFEPGLQRDLPETLDRLIAWHSMTILEKPEDDAAFERAAGNGNGWSLRLAAWMNQVNAPQTESESSSLRPTANRGSPFGETNWSDRIARRLGLESTLRQRGV